MVLLPSVYLNITNNFILFNNKYDKILLILASQPLIVVICPFMITPLDDY